MKENEKSVLEYLFLREKPAKILLGLKLNKDPVYATLLSKEADCTYSHTIKILSLFQKLGMVEFRKEGRIKTVTLTGDGTDIANKLEAVARKFTQLEQSLDAAKDNNKQSVKQQSKKKKKR